MQIKRQDLFTTIRTEGSILPPDLLLLIADESGEIPCLTSADYHLSGERINEAVSRSWNRLQGAWAAFRQASQNLPPTDAGTSLSRERWLLPLFQELGYGRLQAAKSIEIEGKSYPISHLWLHTPVHLVSFRVDLDKRTAGVAGASRSSPHSLVQELLNRETGYLWAFVSNGLRLRILRDNKSLTRQAFVEFDLQAMMDGQVYPDFKLLWLLCHQSRVEGERPEQCCLEKWSQTAIKQGTRALDSLRDGVQRAIEALGRGFLSHPASRPLRDRLQAGTLDKQDYYRQLLRVVYRLIFLFVAEDRGLLLDPASDPKARDRYTRFYSTQRLRALAGKSRGTPHGDLYESLRLVFAKLNQTGCPELGLPALGSFLWSPDAIADLASLKLANRDLLDAIRELAYTLDGQARRPVDYKNLGSEEPGSIYESLLELHPQINSEAATFELITAAGHERKTTGSYYTATSLVNCLLDSALEPVLDAAVRGGPDWHGRGDSAEKRILSLKVCDDACGSGHFLIAAAHRIAKRLAAVRSGDEEPAPEIYRHALRDVIGHCIYGVDINPMAVELCKVSLWMEALEPGKPLSFLDHHIQVGNSLIGATPALLARGIPDETFEPIEGDEKVLCRAFKKQNKDERKGQGMLFSGDRKPWEQLGNLATSLAKVDAVTDETIDGVRLKQRTYDEMVASSTYETGRLLADAWCAAFLWKKTKEFDYPITEAVFRQIEKNPHAVPPWMKDEVRRLARQYQFFHWHLIFPDVFRPHQTDLGDGNDAVGWTGGFDVVLGNPPWEHTELKEKEWFAERHPAIANAPNDAQRKRMITSLRDSDPALFQAFLNAQRAHDAVSHIARSSGRYPLTGRGRTNTYTLFAETNRTILSSNGRIGCIVPSGIATDDTTKIFFQATIDSRSLISLFDIENREQVFEGVHRSFRFSLLTLASPGCGPEAALFAFFLGQVAEMREPSRCFALTQSDIALINPNTRTCPIFASQRDAGIAKSVYRRVPVLLREGPPEQNPWSIQFKQGLFNMATDSHLFRTRQQLDDQGLALNGNIFRGGSLTYMPLYEAKMTNPFDHRHGSIVGSDNMAEMSGIAAQGTTLAEHQDPHFVVLPRYWVAKTEVDSAIERIGLSFHFLIAFRDVARATDVRTAIQAVLPITAVGHKAPLILPMAASATEACAFLGCLNSFAYDYFVRQKFGSASLSFFVVKQTPCPPPAAYRDRAIGLSADWFAARVVELCYTAWDLEPFARDCGYSGPPFRWDEERRFLIRCELDAAYFHLYGISRDDAEYILDTFPIVKRKDIEKHGRYRTKETILEIYDQMARCATTRAPISVPTLRACELVILMLDAWKKPVQRQVADRALVLALNDATRSQVLASQSVGSASSHSLAGPDIRFDTVWKTLQAMKLVTIADTGQSVIVKRVAGSSLQATDPTNLTRANEAIRAFEAIEQRRAAWPDEVDSIEYAFS